MFSGKLFCLAVIIDMLIWTVLRLIQPAKDIELAPDYPCPPAGAHVVDHSSSDLQFLDAEDTPQLIRSRSEGLHTRHS